MRNIRTIAIFSTIFFTSHVLFKEPFEFYIPYAVIILLLPFFALKYSPPTQVAIYFLPLLISGFISVNSDDNQTGEFLKIFVNIAISVSFYYYVIKAYRGDLYELFGYYIRGAYYMSLLGFFQIGCKLVGFKQGYDFSWLLNKWNPSEGGLVGIRVSALFSEPSYFGGTLGAACFVAIYNLFLRKEVFITRFQSLCICAAYLLTASSVAFTGIFVSIVILLLNYGFVRYVIIIAPLLVLGYNYAYYNVPEFRDRLDGLDLLYSGQVDKAWEVHGSSFVQFNNTHVATENLKRHPFFGTGLGSHQFAYDKYSLTLAYGGIYNFNKQDANSMALRLMSETGLYGLIFMLVFCIRFFIRRLNDDSDQYLWIVSGACLVNIILQLLRQGNYTYNGFMFFMWMYYFANKERMELVWQRNSSEESTQSNQEISEPVNNLNL